MFELPVPVTSWKFLHTSGKLDAAVEEGQYYIPASRLTDATFDSFLINKGQVILFKMTRTISDTHSIKASELENLANTVGPTYQPMEEGLSAMDFRVCRTVRRRKHP